MKQATLKRGFHSPFVTLGMLFVDGVGQNAPLYTLEEPWQNNKRKVSCVPAGKYLCVPHNSAKYRNVWRLENVPDRDGILIHAGNTTLDIEGCILVGMSHGVMNNENAVLKSQQAMGFLRALILPSESFELLIS